MTLNPIHIETQRLQLIGYSFQDMKSIFENFSKPEIMKILGHRDEEDFQKEEFKYKNGYAAYNRTFILFLLKDKTTESIIGRCGLHNWNEEHHRAEIGYNISDEGFKRKGLMSEAVSSVIDFGFHQLKLHRIEALVGSENIPSLKIIKNNHFTQEGVLRQHFYVDGKYEDSIVFSLLHNEFKPSTKTVK